MPDEVPRSIGAVVPDFTHFRPTFLALHIAGGLIGLPLLIITLLFSSRISRQPTLINFCITYVITSVSYSLLGFSADPKNPSYSLCFTQAAMIHGAPPMSGMATFLLVFKIWQTFRDPHNYCTWSTRGLILSVALPYIAFFCFLIASIVIQHQYPQSLTWSRGLYCTQNGVKFRRWGVPIFSIIILILILGFETSIAVRYFRSRRSITTSFPLASRSTSLGLIVRISIFNVYLLITFGASIIFIIGNNMQVWPYMVQAALPLVAFILFATQKNVILTWCFWVEKDKDIPSGSDDSMPTARRPHSDTPLDMSSITSRNVHRSTLA